MNEWHAGIPVPAVGRMVHYVAYGSADGTHPQACRPALVTEVGAWVDEEVRPLDDSTQRRRILVQRFDPIAVGARVITPSGEFTHGALVHDAGHEPHDLDAPIPDLCTGRLHPGGTWHWPTLR